jgi:hypothetical protein
VTCSASRCSPSTARERTARRPGVGTDPAFAQLREIETNFDYLDGKINGLCSTSPVYCPDVSWEAEMPIGIGSCTHPGIAMEQAKNELITRTDQSTFFRGMVVMSDGVANCGPISAFTQAEEAWANDINIWSIVFHNGSFNAAYMEGIVRGIGFSQVSPDAADLPLMYETVAKSLPTTLVD